MVDGVNPSEVWPPFGPFSMAVIQGDGQIVHLKGQVSLDREGNVVGPGDMRVQVRQVFQNIRDILATMGGELGDIVSVVHHTTDIAGFMAAGDVRRDFLLPPYPVSTTVEIVRLYCPELIIETTVVAEIPKRRFRRPDAARAPTLWLTAR